MPVHSDLAALGADPVSVSDSIQQQLRKACIWHPGPRLRSSPNLPRWRTPTCSACLHFIEGPDAERVEAIANDSLQAALTDFFTKKKSKLTKSFFPDLFKKVPTLVPAAFPTLIKLTVGARSPYLQNEALLLLGSAAQMIDADEAKSLFADNDDETKAMLDCFAASGSREVRKTGQKMAVIRELCDLAV